MNTQDKSKALAALMHWKPGMSNGRPPVYRTIVRIRRGIQVLSYLEPYSESECGLAQFAAILLEFPEAVTYFACNANKPVTQENLLDEILRMHGVME